jgi:hypothetical protein
MQENFMEDIFATTLARRIGDSVRKSAETGSETSVFQMNMTAHPPHGAAPSVIVWNLAVLVRST